MYIQLSNKHKKDCFISIFNLIKNSSLFLNAIFTLDGLNIQGMDKSHICLFNLRLDKSWFDLYEVDKEEKLCLDSNIFYSIISSKSEGQVMNIIKKNDEVLEIEFTKFISLQNDTTQNKKNDENNINYINNDFNKYFTMNLTEYEYDEINIKSIDYDCSFKILSKQIDAMITQLSNFGDSISVECDEEKVNLKTQGINGALKISINLDDLLSYEIVESSKVLLYFNLIIINKMCITSKLTNNIEISLSLDNPLKIEYNLDNNSNLVFYIAPQIVDV